MDNLLYELSVTDEKFSEVFINREIVTGYDNQNGIYSTNSIQLDLSSIANANRWTSWREGSINFPVVLTIRDTDANATANVGLNGNCFQSIVGLKNSFQHLIHSMTVKVNNTEVISQTELSSVPHTFRLLTELSQEEQEKMGASLGFYKDSSESWSYSGNVIQNNGSNGTLGNSGLERRQDLLRVLAPSTTKTGTANALRNTSTIVTNDNFYQQWGMGAWYPATGTDDDYRVFYGVITIKLADLHDFFRQVPLMKGAYVTMNLIVNQATVDFTYSTTDANPYSSVSVNVPSSGVCPIMLNGYPLNDKDVACQADALENGHKYRVSIGIARAFDSSLTNTIDSHPIFNTIQVRVPQYDMNPAYAKMYEGTGVEKEIRYIDYQRPTLPTLSAGAQINNQFSTGIARLRSVLVCPMFASASNGGIVPFQSPLTSEPATCSPYSHLGSYNIIINGKPVYPADVKNYSYQMFQDELALLGVNGDLTRGLTSGLISQKDWENNYGFYYTNTARRMPEVYESATSVSVQCSNKTKLSLDLQAFLCYEKRVVINVWSGQVKSFV